MLCHADARARMRRFTFRGEQLYDLQNELWGILFSEFYAHFKGLRHLSLRNLLRLRKFCPDTANKMLSVASKGDVSG
jgi:hypothetical protein